MKKSFIRKIGYLFGVMFIIATVSLTSSTYAASVGDKLTAPEEGWVRYDDKDPLITYTGAWSTDTNAVYYKGSQKYTQTGSYSFKFTGNSFRLLGSTNKTIDSSNIQITINGVSETFSGVKEVNNNQVIVFEKVNLPFGEYNVVVKNLVASKNITLDAIDLKIEDVKGIRLNAAAGNSLVSLNWDSIQNAASYIVKYGTEAGKYTETVTATKDEYGNFVVTGLTNGTTYYFVVSAVNNGVESEFSNEASATPQGLVVEPEEPSGNRAILVVTMTTGLEKEFDLSMQEVNSFIDWYETKQTGSGKASYAIDKHDNNKGPFKSRKDYILFDRVLTFEVSEY